MIDEQNLQLLERSWQRSFLTYPFSQNQSDSLFTQLLKAYSESQRSYHTLQHLVECLN